MKRNRSIKINERVYQKLEELKGETHIPINELVEILVEEALKRVDVCEEE